MKSPEPEVDDLDTAESPNQRSNNSSYTDSLEGDTLSQPTNDVNGNDGKYKKSRLPIKSPTDRVRTPVRRPPNGQESPNLNFPDKEAERRAFDCLVHDLEKITGPTMYKSLSDLTCLNNCGVQTARETITSRLRFEKGHEDHNKHDNDLDTLYLTPTQRKDQLIKDLKRKVKELTNKLDEKDAHILQMTNTIGNENSEIVDIKDKVIQKIEEDLNVAQVQCADLTKSYEESVKSVNSLETTVAELRDALAEQTSGSEMLYLETYRKGQESVRWERDDELEVLACNASKKDKVSMEEVVRKLSKTQQELARWQSLKREEIYAAEQKPDTEAGTVLRFLKDSFFHYLTDTKDSEFHLRAIIRILKFPDVQRRKIEQAQKEKKKGKHK